MYQKLIFFHSLVRWLVFISLVISIFRAYRGWFSKKNFTKTDDSIRHTTATIAHIQLILGLWLYFISPIIDYFLKNFKTAVHEREIRFFGMEHSLMMLLAIVLITIGSMKAKRREQDEEKFKTIAIWYSVAFFIIILNIPWQFSPLTARPYFRYF